MCWGGNATDTEVIGIQKKEKINLIEEVVEGNESCSGRASLGMEESRQGSK